MKETAALFLVLIVMAMLGRDPVTGLLCIAALGTYGLAMRAMLRNP